MAFEIRVTEAAIADLEEILAYSQEKFPELTERFASAMLNHLDLLRTFPYIGSPVTKRPGVRRLVHTPVLIYYRVNEEANIVDVLHFWHSARNPARL